MTKSPVCTFGDRQFKAYWAYRGVNKRCRKTAVYGHIDHYTESGEPVLHCFRCKEHKEDCCLVLDDLKGRRAKSDKNRKTKS